jgi:hypothetical protein
MTARHTPLEINLLRSLKEAIAYIEATTDAVAVRRIGGEIASVSIAKHSADIGIIFDVQRARNIVVEAETQP